MAALAAMGVLGLTMAAGPVQAACTGSPNITCTGDTVDPVLSDDDGAVLTVEGDSSIIVPDDVAVTMTGDGASVDNMGRIETILEENPTIVHEGADFAVTNAPEALIVSTDKGIERDGDESGLTVVNTGRIETQGDAIEDDNGSVNLTNNTDGIIQSFGGKGLQAEGDETVVWNDGIISAEDKALEVGEDFMLTNNGLIESKADRAIEVGGEGGLLENYGNIEALDDAIRADEGDLRIFNGTEDDPGPKIVSTGTEMEDGVLVGFKGIRARGADTEIVNWGEIEAQGEAVEGRDAFTLTNGGGITSTLDDAIQFGDGALFNRASGEITGGDDGVDVDSGLIENKGLITSSSMTDGAAIAVDPDGEDGNPAGTLVIDNEGTIRAVIGILFDPASTARQTIFNKGVIEGTGGTAIHFAPSQGASLLELSENSVIRGDVIFGNSDDVLQVNDITSGVLIASGFFGMAGTNSVVFADTYALSDFLSANIFNKVVRLNVEAENGDLLSGEWIDFGEFVIAGTAYTPEELAAIIPPVPLPASLLLLAGGLGGLVLMRRRR